MKQGALAVASIPARSGARVRAALLALLLALALFAPLTPAAEDDAGIIVRNSDVLSEPADGADSLATLTLGNRVRVTELRGRWAQVETGEGDRGWIPAANVRLGKGKAESRSGGAVSGLLRSITGSVAGLSSSDESSEAAHVGIRGLQPEDVANAEPDPEALKQLEEYRASAETAAAHARRIALASRKLEYLEPEEKSAPAPPPTTDRRD